MTGGENVYSGEVEAVIYEHPAVLEAAVFGIPDLNGASWWPPASLSRERLSTAMN